MLAFQMSCQTGHVVTLITFCAVAFGGAIGTFLFALKSRRNALLVALAIVAACWCAKVLHADDVIPPESTTCSTCKAGDCGWICWLYWCDCN